jgi:hypothetical protein
MTTDTLAATRARASTAPSAASTRLRTFAVTFSTVGPVAYLVALYMNWPVFTYHPATNRFAWGLEAARSGEGPNMTWYGWTLTALLAAAVLGFLATLLPERIARRIPLNLVWIIPWLAIPFLVWDLRQWWLHP